MKKPRNGLNGNRIANQAGRPKRRRNHPESADTDNAETAGPGFIARARQRRRERKTNTTNTDETPAKTPKKEVKPETKPQVKDEYEGVEFPFDDGGFPVNIPTNKTPEPEPPVDDMGFPMYPAPKPERAPKMSNPNISNPHVNAVVPDKHKSLSKAWTRSRDEATKQAQENTEAASEMRRQSQLLMEKHMNESAEAYLKSAAELDEAAENRRKIAAAHDDMLSQLKSAA